MSDDKLFYDVIVEGKLKKPRRKPSAMYQRRLSKLHSGQILRVNIYNWNARCATPPNQYIPRVYKGLYKVIEKDLTGFTVECIQRKERWPLKME